MNRKKVWIGLAAGIGIVILAAAVVLGAVCWKGKRRIESFSDGFSFDAEYRITLSEQGETENAVLRLMDEAGLCEGTVRGERAQGITHFELIPADREELTAEVYVSGQELLVNMERLYEGQKGKITEHLPLVGALLPDWSMGAYISLEQLEEVVGKEIGRLTIPEDMEWSLLYLKHIRYEGGNPDMLYFQLKHEVSDGYDFVIGISKNTLFEGTMDCVLMIEKENQYQISISAAVEPDCATVPAMPEDVMTEAEIGKLKTIREAVEQAVGLLESLKE